MIDNNHDPYSPDNANKTTLLDNPEGWFWLSGMFDANSNESLTESNVLAFEDIIIDEGSSCLIRNGSEAHDIPCTDIAKQLCVFWKSGYNIMNSASNTKHSLP